MLTTGSALFRQQTSNNLLYKNSCKNGSTEHRFSWKQLKTPTSWEPLSMSMLAPSHQSPPLKHGKSDQQPVRVPPRLCFNLSAPERTSYANALTPRPTSLITSAHYNSLTPKLVFQHHKPNPSSNKFSGCTPSLHPQLRRPSKPRNPHPRRRERDHEDCTFIGPQPATFNVWPTVRAHTWFRAVPTIKSFTNLGPFMLLQRFWVLLRCDNICWGLSLRGPLG